MNSNEVVVYIEGYKITRGDYIKLNDTAYKVDASKITTDDYMENNTRAITSSYVSLGYNSFGAAYKTAIMYYVSSYGSFYSQTVVREYATGNLILNWLNANPSNTNAGSLALSLCQTIANDMAHSVLFGGSPLSTIAEVAYTALLEYQDIAMRNAFRTYSAGGNGGYIDVIENSNGKTVGYGVWNQSTIEIKSGSSNGQTMTTTYEKSTNG